MRESSRLSRKELETFLQQFRTDIPVYDYALRAALLEDDAELHGTLLLLQNYRQESIDLLESLLS